MDISSPPARTWAAPAASPAPSTRPPARGDGSTPGPKPSGAGRIGAGALGLALALILVLASGASAATADDAYIAGYAAAVLERQFALTAATVTVTDGVVTVGLPGSLPGSLPRPERERVLAALSSIRGVMRVEIIQTAAPPAPVGPAPVPPVAAESGFTAEVPPPGPRFLPGGHLFNPLLADPRWPRFSVSYLRYLGDREIRNVGATSFGETFAFFRDRAPFGGEWEIGLQAGVFAIFDLDADSTDLVNADYFVALPVGYRRGDLSALWRIFHQSSHLGDEFLLRSRVDRVNLSYEGVDLKLSYDLHPSLRLYAGGGYLFRREPPDLEPWSAQVGVEYRSPWALLDGALRPVAALDLQSRQENAWSVDVSLRAGVQFEALPLFDRRLQLMLEYFNGHSPNGQFYRRKIEYLGLGVHLFLF